MLKLLGVAVLGLGLLSPTAVMLSAAPQDHHDQPKHEWNDGEKDAWHRYLKERHIKDHEWDHAKKSEKANYWKWRDSHPDNH
jgi:hypothetical protein